MFNKITSFSIDKNNVEILDNELVKTASEIILPEGHSYDPDFVYMKVRAVSAGEFWGCNKNADFFPEEELKKNYKTFFDAHVFKNHENKEVEKAIGDVLDTIWNDEMKYVELLIRVDKRIAPTIARGFEKGFMTDVSMGCKIDHSICSICGNLAKTQSQYCDHIRHEKHKVRDDGKKVYEININPRFHDISAVLNGADRTAKMTGLFISGTKVAFHQEETMEKCASTLADALFDEVDMEKEAKLSQNGKILAGCASATAIAAPLGHAYKSKQKKKAQQKEDEWQNQKKKMIADLKTDRAELSAKLDKQNAEWLERTKWRNENGYENHAEFAKKFPNNNQKIMQKKAGMNPELAKGLGVIGVASVPVGVHQSYKQSQKNKEYREKGKPGSYQRMAYDAAISISKNENFNKKLNESGKATIDFGNGRQLTMQKKAFENSLLDSLPIFDKTASTRVTKKASELEKIAEIKKRIRGNVLAVAQSRAVLAEKERIDDAAQHARTNGILRPLNKGVMNRFADGINGLSDSEEVMAEQVLTTALKMLSLAGVNLSPAEFVHIMRRVIGIPKPKIVRTCPHNVDKEKMMRVFDGSVNRARHEMSGTNIPTMFNILRTISGQSLPVVQGHKPSVPARIVITKIASCQGVTRPELSGLNLEEKCIKLASEIIKEKSLHLPHMTKRAMEVMEEAEMEKEASAKLCTTCAHAGADVYAKLNDGFHRTDRQDKDAEYVKCSKNGGAFKQKGDVCEIFAKETETEKTASMIDYYYDYLATPTEKIASEDVYEAVERQAYGVYQNLVADYVQSDSFNGDLYRFANEVGVDNQSMEKCAKNIMKSMNTGLGTYLYSKYQGVGTREGKPQSTINRTMGENPEAAAIGAALATKGILDKAPKIKEGAKKALKYVAKTANENMDIYLDGDISKEASEDALQDIDIFKDSVINEKLASEYTNNQIKMIKTASIMYAQGRQDLCDSLLATEGLGYDSVNNFLQICEDTLFDELEKKASIGSVVKAVAKPVLGAAKSVVGKVGAKFGGKAAAKATTSAGTGLATTGTRAVANTAKPATGLTTTAPKSTALTGTVLNANGTKAGKSSFNPNAFKGSTSSGSTSSGTGQSTGNGGFTQGAKDAFGKAKGAWNGLNTKQKVGAGAMAAGTAIGVNNSIQQKKKFDEMHETLTNQK